MTTEVPDGPMPICMSPESFRAAVDRAKKAEQRVEELERLVEDVVTRSNRAAEQHHQDIDRLSLENAQFRANVATLTTEREDSERQYAGLHVQFHDLVRESNGLRDRLAALVEQLGEAERRIEGLLLENECAANLIHELQDGAGAAQPVVEPRDEAVPPRPVCDHDRLLAVAYAFNRWANASWSQKEALDAIGEALGDPFIYDAEHGYAPHPSGTEGPLVADLLVVLDAPKRDDVKLEAIRAAVVKHAAASPPDGTAPERVRRIVGKGTCAVEWCDNDKVPDHGFCEAHATAEQIAAAENWTSGSVDRLAESKARRAAEMAADAKRLHEELSRLFGIEYEADVDYVWAPGPVDELLKYADELQREHIARQESATRPPDGMHGEPALEDPPEDYSIIREGEHGWTAWYKTTNLGYCSSRDNALSCCRTDAKHRAAPPTVPGEPPRRRKRCEGVVEPVGINRTDAAPPTPPLTPERAPLDAEVKLHLKDYRGLDELRRVHEWLNTGRSVAVMCEDAEVMRFEPPAERAPLDEAAVRADERARLRERLIELRKPYGDERAVAFNTITAVGEELFGERMPPGPRRSEGAG